MKHLHTLIILLIPLLLAPTEILDDVIEAMAWVESRHDPTVYNPEENAVGYLQIRPIMIREVNRLLEIEGSTTRYTHEHAWDMDCSIEIFKQWVRLNNYKEPEIMARNWNGGYNGINLISTYGYWMEVKNYYNKLKEK